MINRPAFYQKLKSTGLFKTLSQSQVDGCEATINEWILWINNNWVDDDIRKLAYIFATDYHEGDKTMQPIKEYGGDKYYIKKYWTNQQKAKELGNLSAQDAIDFCGKGKPMITGRANYTKMGKILGYNLATNPDLMLDLKIATEVMFEGMLTGKSLVASFTGKSLSNYFNKTTCEPVKARYVVNGQDDAGLIASYYDKFLIALAA